MFGKNIKKINILLKKINMYIFFLAIAILILCYWVDGLKLVFVNTNHI